MPSNKAVLRDIHDLRLDPKKPHRATRASGRLHKGHDKAKQEVVNAVPVKEENLRLGFVELQAQAPHVQPVVDVEKPKEEPPPVETPQTEALPKVQDVVLAPKPDVVKKEKQTKKLFEKKDKPEGQPS
jgi:hypothetical protein